MVGEDLASPETKSWLYHPAFPKHWERRPLYLLASWVNGIVFRDIQFSKSGKPVIKIAEIKGGITPQTKFTTQVFDESVHVRAGDLLFSWSGQPETSIDVFWWRGPDGWLNQHSFRVTPTVGIDPTFFFYLLRYLKPSFVGIARNKQTTGLGHVTKGDLENIEAAYPVLREQRAIAHILGTLDDKIELNRRINETLEAMAQAFFKSWFVDFDPVRAKAEGRDTGLPKHIADLFPARFVDSELGEIPEGWEIRVLDDCIENILGGDWGGDNHGTEQTEAVRCIRGADIPDLQIGGIGKMPVRYLKPSSLSRRHLKEGDLVIEISGGSPTQSTGRPVLVSRELIDRIQLPLVCSNFCRFVKLRSPSQSKFIYLWLRMLYANDELIQFENGTTGIKNMAFSLFCSTFKFVMPTSNVLDAFDKHVSLLFHRQQIGAGEGENLASIRNTLLPKLISGDLCIKSPKKFIGEMREPY